MVGEREFRRVMSHFATGVTVVTSRGVEGEPVGLTVNAFTSVSLDPILVLVCVHRDASGHDLLLEHGIFGVTVMARGQDPLARRFSEGESGARFQGVPYRIGTHGSPFLEGGLAWLECRVSHVYPGGDHSIILGEVLSCEAREGEPLLFFRGELGVSLP